VQRAESALGVPFTITFAQTEASPCITQTRQDDSADDRARTLGRPHPHVEVKIADPVTEEALPRARACPTSTGASTLPPSSSQPPDTPRQKRS
jgi:acyl-CoA synthetase (AMP-forming)/AMP-acid ligase II